MTAAISLRGVSRRYREQLALDDVTLEIEGPSITGLLGRNGAGKTTLLRIVATQEFPSAGTVRVCGADPFADAAALQRLVLVREDQGYPELKVRQALRVASWFYPHWSDELAGSLLEDFALPPGRAVKKLSHGMRSALGAVIGLASRAEVTLLDEPYSGLDAVARQMLYDRLLADFTAHPRTIVLSTHLVDEAADLLERVVVIDRGRVTIDALADDLRGSATAVSGPASAVEDFAAGRRAYARRTVASRASVVVAEVLDDADRAAARELHLSLEPLSLQQLMVHAADKGVSGRLMERSSA